MLTRGGWIPRARTQEAGALLVTGLKGRYSGGNGGKNMCHNGFREKLGMEKGIPRIRSKGGEKSGKVGTPVWGKGCKDWSWRTNGGGKRLRRNEPNYKRDKLTPHLA